MSASCPLERKLSDYVDGELELRQMARVRDHLDGCRECANAEAELRRLAQALRTLSADDPPPDRVWAGIEAGLRADARPAWAAGRWLRRASLGVGFAAAATTGILALGRSLSGHPALAQAEQTLRADAERQLRAAEMHYAQAARDLRAIAARQRPSWRPEVVRAYDENLRTIDEAIDRLRAAALGRPADATTMDHLFAAYRRQIEFIEESIQTGAAGGRELDPL